VAALHANVVSLPMKPTGLVKADFVSALVLVALGVGTMVESWNMPRLEERGVQPYTVPGLVPGLLGAILVILGLVLLVRSSRAGGWRLFAEGDGGIGADAVRRVALVLVLTFGYAIGLIGNTPYELATGVFVFAFIAVFEWQKGEALAPRARRLASAAFQAILVTLVVTVVFERIFLVRLP
jgi:putative tricarboxylic transport membrane protein